MPLFAGLSVSGTFNYANSVPAVGVVTGPAVPGAAIYAGAPTSIAGSVNGLNFSDSSGFVVVGNDRFVNTGLTDFLSVAAGQLDTAAFEINGFTLVDVRLFWIESDTTIEDFLVSDLLPTALPEIEGRLALDFTPTADPGVETSVFFDGLFVSPMP